jgi:hypothetical protein
MKGSQLAILLAMLVGTSTAAWQECTAVCKNIKNKKPCLKQSKNGCCVFNRKQRKCVDWPACSGLKKQDCHKDPTCLFSWKGNTNDWVDESNIQSRRGGCVDTPPGFDKALCQYNTRRGCQKLDYCKWRRNQNMAGGKCINNGNPTGSPTAPTDSPTKAPSAAPTAQPTAQPSLAPTPAYTGTYTETVDVIMTGTGTTQKCGGVNAVTGQTIEQMVDCETNCNSCALCVGYNWQLEGFNNAGVGSYKCVYKNGGSASANPGSSYFAKP